MPPHSQSSPRSPRSSRTSLRQTATSTPPSPYSPQLETARPVRISSAEKQHRNPLVSSDMARGIWSAEDGVIEDMTTSPTVAEASTVSQAAREWRRRATARQEGSKQGGHRRSDAERNRSPRGGRPGLQKSTGDRGSNSSICSSSSSGSDRHRMIRTSSSSSCSSVTSSVSRSSSIVSNGSMSMSMLESEEECECDSIGSGLPGTSGYRLKFRSAHGAEISPWHQLPLPASVPVPPPSSPPSDPSAPCLVNEPGRVTSPPNPLSLPGRAHANFAELLSPSPRRSACPAPLRFVCQTPRGSVVAFDVAADEPATPLRLRRAPTATTTRNSGTTPRSAGSRSPSSSPPRLARPLALAAPCSCGFLPQTCALELPRALLSAEGVGEAEASWAEKVEGAEACGMPMMAVEIGLNETWTGDVRRVIPLAAMTVCVTGSRGDGDAVSAEIAASDGARSGGADADENRRVIASRGSTDGGYGRMMWVVVTIAADDPEAADVWRFMRRASEETIEGIVSGVRRWLEDVYLPPHMPAQADVDPASFRPSGGYILAAKPTSRLLIEAHEAWKEALPSFPPYQLEHVQQQQQQQQQQRQQWLPVEQRSACSPSSKQQHQTKPMPARLGVAEPKHQVQAPVHPRPPRGRPPPAAASPKPPRHRGHVSPTKGSPKQDASARKQGSLTNLFLFEPDNVAPMDRVPGLCLSEEASSVCSAGSHGADADGAMVDLFQSALSVSPAFHARRSSSSGSSGFGSFDGEECLSSAGSLDLDGGIADVLKWRQASQKRHSSRRLRHGEGAVSYCGEGGHKYSRSRNPAAGHAEVLPEEEAVVFLRETPMARGASGNRRRTVRFDEVVEVHIFENLDEGRLDGDCNDLPHGSGEDEYDEDEDLFDMHEVELKSLEPIRRSSRAHDVMAQ